MALDTSITVLRTTDSPHCQTVVIKSPRQMHTRQLQSTLLGSIKVVVSIEVVPIDRPVLRLSVPCTSRNTALLSRRGLKAKPCCYILYTRSLPVRLSLSSGLLKAVEPPAWL